MWVNSAIGSYYKWDQRFHHVRQRWHAIWVSTQEDRLKQMIRSPIAAALTVGLASPIRIEKRTLGVATPNDHIIGRYEHVMRFALVDLGGCWAEPSPH